MHIPFKYNIKSLLRRKVSAILTIVGMSLVVMIFVTMLAMANGMRQAMVSTGSPDNIIIMNKSSAIIEYSLLPKIILNTIKYLPGIKKNPQGLPLVSPENYIVKIMEIEAGQGMKIIRFRGVTPVAFEIYPQVKIIEGGKPGAGEIMIGKFVPLQLGNLKIGDKLEIGRQEHTIVGIFEAQGTIYENEVWMDMENMMFNFDMDQFSLIVIKVDSPSLIEPFISNIKQNKQLPMVDAIAEKEYYATLAKGSIFILAMGRFIALILGIGAIFGGMNTMYTAIAKRTREIGTLKAIGFSKINILSSFLVESVIITVISGTLGCLLSVILNGYTLTFLGVTFGLKINILILLQGLLLSLFVGIMGGLWPARSAARMETVDALRHI